MSHTRPDGMATPRTEIQEMKQARQETHTPDWELAALDADGNQLYRTEYADTEAEAQQVADSIDPSQFDDVAAFEPVPTED